MTEDELREIEVCRYPDVPLLTMEVRRLREENARLRRAGEYFYLARHGTALKAPPEAKWSVGWWADSESGAPFPVRRFVAVVGLTREELDAVCVAPERKGSENE